MRWLRRWLNRRLDAWVDRLLGDCRWFQEEESP